MKYIIDVPDNTKQIDAMYLWYVLKSYPLSELEPYIEPDRKAIEDEVWEFIRICLVMDGFDFVDAFDSCSYINLLKYSYQEAKAKYEAWLKQKDELNFGDEIISVDDVKAVMLDRVDNESIHVMTEHGCVEQWKNLDVVKKTGKKIFQG